MSNTNPPLHIAVENGNIDIVKMLLEAGHSPNEANADGLTPLHIAIQRGHTEIAALFADKTKESGTAPLPGITRTVPMNNSKNTSRFGTTTKIIIVIAIIIVSCKAGWEWAKWDFNNARPFIEAMAYDKGYKEGYQAGAQGLTPAH
jgi:hypothetical protein